MPIEILPPEIVSLIAAGEVIESPASVLKELIENSIDAGATAIKIDIKKAGKKTIKVIDNGCGMSEKDLRMSILPHATSKIKSYNDIFNIYSYGFRGEALYSIFSVSKIKINTWDTFSQTGFSLSGGGGNISEVNILPAPPIKGTTIEVSDLFFNTPARLKFLKNDNSLRASIIRVVEDFILSHPQISFILTIDDREIFNILTGKDFKTIKERVKKILSAKTSEKMIEFNAEKGYIRIKGLISNPDNLIATRQNQYTFVNKRSIENKIIQQAIYKAYEHIRNGKHPAWIFFIDIPPDKLDINVHPQKKEIKFSEEKVVYEAIYEIISNSLSGKQLPVSIPVNYENDKKEVLDFISEKDIEKEKDKNLYSYSSPDLIEQILEEKDSPLWYNPPIIFIGQIFNSILLFQTRTSLLIVDQHAAVERIMFEKYIQEFKQNSIQIQTLLLPVLIEMSASSAENIIKWKDWLKKAGFEINRNSPTSIMVYSTPSIFYFTQEGLRDFFSYLSEIFGNPQTLSEELKRDSIATLACKKSIKAGDKITKESALLIIEDLKKCKDSLHCPHGRPTIIEITLDELIRKFGRTSI